MNVIGINTANARVVRSTSIENVYLLFLYLVAPILSTGLPSPSPFEAPSDMAGLWAFKVGANFILLSGFIFVMQLTSSLRLRYRKFKPCPPEIQHELSVRAFELLYPGWPAIPGRFRFWLNRSEAGIQAFVRPSITGPAIIVSYGLLIALRKRQRGADLIFAHELGHAIHRDDRFVSIANTLNFGNVVATLLSSLLALFRRDAPEGQIAISMLISFAVFYFCQFLPLSKLLHRRELLADAFAVNQVGRRGELCEMLARGWAPGRLFHPGSEDRIAALIQQSPIFRRSGLLITASTVLMALTGLRVLLLGESYAALALIPFFPWLFFIMREIPNNTNAVPVASDETRLDDMDFDLDCGVLLRGAEIKQHVCPAS